MHHFFRGLHLPETLPGLDEPLPASVEMAAKLLPDAPKAHRATTPKIRGSATLAVEARRREAW